MDVVLNVSQWEEGEERRTSGAEFWHETELGRLTSGRDQSYEQSKASSRRTSGGEQNHDRRSSSGGGRRVSREFRPPTVEEVSRPRSADVRLTARHHDVYEPCDDSFALVDALMADQAYLRELDPKLCVEVGSGSGFVITSLALIIGDHGSTRFIATDVNPTAAQATKETLEAHGVEAEAIVTDLVNGLEKHLERSVDVLLFNPPYVPTDEEDVGGVGAMAAWAGGSRGRTVIDRFLPLVDGLLSPNGLLYMVTLTTNDPQEICRDMKRQGFASRIVIQRQTEEESLQVIRFMREAPEAAEKLKEERTFGSLSLKRFAFWRS